MRRALLPLALLLLGFVAKVGVAEAERMLAVGYADECIANRKPQTREERAECYLAAKNHSEYRVVEILNAQPNFWMP
jgi:hypothetical protein